jgi:hypothetical protein
LNDDQRSRLAVFVSTSLKPEDVKLLPEQGRPICVGRALQQFASAALRDMRAWRVSSNSLSRRSTLTCVWRFARLQCLELPRAFEHLGILARISVAVRGLPLEVAFSRRKGPHVIN